MTLEQVTELYASVLRQLLPEGGYDKSPNTVIAKDIYAHAKLLAQADLDAHRLLKVIDSIPEELIDEFEYEYGLPLKCSTNVSRTFAERVEILKWVRNNQNVYNKKYLTQLFAIFGVVLVDVIKFKPIQCTAPCNAPVNTEQLRYKVRLHLLYPVNADIECIIENYLPAYLRVDWMIDMPWGEWVVNCSNITVNRGIAHYTASKNNQVDYYDSFADLDLTEAIVRALHDVDMQKWQAVIDAANELTGVTDWMWDVTNNGITYIKTADPNDPQDDSYGKYMYSMGFGRFYSPNEACRSFTNAWSTSGITFVSANDTTCTTNQSGTIYSYNWVERVTNLDYVTPSESYNKKSISFDAVAQKIISNSQSSNQAISLLAEAFLETVAKSICNSDNTKQFVKLIDLISQFEQNKVLRKNRNYRHAKN
ncbi:DUF2313 domain-containing protein [Acinetobacter wuhouensis]|uniref:DUF2313 domain-containing protein n=1 Tax=Acinetobacter wuhouensis TaxID=1879050 RepID=A0A3G2T7S2_9GAMM|nr:DUF2313 domain-containing protein [Acinetobacter wuhouensis]